MNRADTWSLQRRGDERRAADSTYCAWRPPEASRGRLERDVAHLQGVRHALRVHDDAGSVEVDGELGGEEHENLVGIRRRSERGPQRSRRQEPPRDAGLDRLRVLRVVVEERESAGVDDGGELVRVGDAVARGGDLVVAAPDLRQNLLTGS
jgi:hypothetical protein